MDDADSYREDGFVVIPDFLKAAEIDSVVEQLNKVSEAGIGDKRFLDKEWCRVLSHVVRLRLLKRRLLYLASAPVLCTYFDKTPDANWGAQSGRDVSIPVLKRVEMVGWNQWTQWQGIPHVHPPITVSRSVVVVRVHIDDCDKTTGALQVAPGSHRHDTAAIATKRCHGAAGSALVFSPLLVRKTVKPASLQSQQADCRVLQYLFGPSALPDDVQWYYKS